MLLMHEPQVHRILGQAKPPVRLFPQQSRFPPMFSAQVKSTLRAQSHVRNLRQLQYFLQVVLMQDKKPNVRHFRKFDPCSAKSAASHFLKKAGGFPATIRKTPAYDLGLPFCFQLRNPELRF